MELTTETKTKNAIKWLEALISGKYKQGKGYLGDEEVGFCCWGLGCHIVGFDYNPKNGWNENLYVHIGFKNKDARIAKEFYDCDDLAKINDGTNAGFKRIGKMLIKTAKDNFEFEVAEGIIKHFQK